MGLPNFDYVEDDFSVNSVSNQPETTPEEKNSDSSSGTEQLNSSENVSNQPEEVLELESEQSEPLDEESEFSTTEEEKPDNFSEENVSYQAETTTESLEKTVEEENSDSSSDSEQLNSSENASIQPEKVLELESEQSESLDEEAEPSTSEEELDNFSEENVSSQAETTTENLEETVEEENSDSSSDTEQLNSSENVSNQTEEVLELESEQSESLDEEAEPSTSEEELDNFSEENVSSQAETTTENLEETVEEENSDSSSDTEQLNSSENTTTPLEEVLELESEQSESLDEESESSITQEEDLTFNTFNSSEENTSIAEGEVDFEISEVTTPSTVNLGESFEVSWTVDNLEENSLPDSEYWYDTIYLSSDTNLDEAEYFYLTDTYIDAFQFDRNSYTQSTFVTINQIGIDPEQDWYLVFETDTYDYQLETDENNNSFAVPVELTAPDLDLIVSEANVPSEVDLGETFEVSWTITNQGEDSTTTSWYDGVYISDDENFDFSDTYLTQFWSGENTPLESGSSYTNTTNITIPSNQIGERYLLFTADQYNYQFETDETNNTLAIPINISGEGPNLTISDATAPDSTIINQNIEVSWTVLNEGEVDASANWYDYIYLSNDELFDNTDTFLRSYWAGNQTPVAVGESYTQTYNFSLPNSAESGSQYLIFAADGSKAQPETDETDNFYALPIEIEAPNLIVSDATAPTSGIPGSTVEVAWTVENNGDVEAPGNWYDFVYISEDKTLDNSDISLTSQWTGNNTPLAAGDDYTITRNLILSSDLEAGNYYLLFEADRYNYQGEIDETDNVYSLPFEVLDKPNLVINSDPTAPESAIVGETVEVSWTVTNDGDVEAPANWYDYIYLSDDTEFDNGDRFVTSVWTGDNTPLAAGESYLSTRNITLPNNAELGSQYLIFVADRFNYQPETDETDNNRAIPITINAPNLVIDSDPTAPESAIVGETVEVSWTVINDGDVEAPANWRDYIYLSDDTTFDNGDRFVTYVWTGDNTPLAAGESYISTRNITLPSNAEAGSQYLIFVADRFNYQPETDETDNNQAVAIDLSAPNLVVTDHNAPNWASIGETLELSWTVENQGDVTALGNWYDYIYVSEDETLDNNDTYLGGTWAGSQTPLASGDSYTLSRNVTLPINQQGDRYLLFVADGSTNQGETDETDNVLAVPLTIDDNGPNLEITDVTSPESVYLGETVELSWTVANSGGVAASANWWDAVYISDDETFDNSDTFVYQRSINSQTPLAAEDDYTITQNVTIPTTELGDRYLLFIADYWVNRQTETDETDNVVAVPLEVGALEVDLVVSEISAPLEAISGEEIEIIWTITNQGNEEATGTWVDQLYFSEDREFGSDQSLGAFSFTGTIAPGESLERQQTITLPSDLEGDRYVIVRTDANNQLVEFSNEDNNTTISTEPISVALSPFPNLQVSSVTAPETAFSSQETVVEWVVSNVGNGATSVPVWYDRIWLSLDQELDPTTDVYLGQAANSSYLNAGDSYSNSLTVTLPEGIDANYYFLVETDYNNQVDELENENDNLGIGGPTDIELTPPPDLQVTSVNPPSQAFSGQPMSLSWTVTNEGLGRTLETAWYDEIYMSADEVIDDSDYYLGRQYHTGILNSGENYTTTRNVTLPIGISGDFHFLVRTDSFDQVYEQAFEENNDTSSSLTLVNLTPPPDLEVEFVDAPAEATASRDLTLNYQVTNFGATETPRSFWRDAFYLSTDNQLDRENDLYLGERNYYSFLNPGDSVERSATFTLSNDLSGDYYAFVVTDSRDEVFELDNDNNINLDETAIAISSRPGDLVVSEASAPSTAEAGKAIAIEWTVTNEGTGDTAANRWVDRIIASTDENLNDLDDVVLGEFTRNGLLEVGESYSRDELVALPFDLAGEYNLYVVTDARSQVYEATNEANNDALAAAITINRITPDLQVTEISASETATSNTPFTVNWTVQNLGAGQTNTDYWYDQVFLSTDTDLGDSNDISLGVVRRSSILEPSGEYEVSHSFDLPVDIAGEYYVIVETDSTERVIEDTAENNNEQTSNQTTAISLGLVPDLVIADINAPSEGISGQFFDLNWTVRNDGTETENPWRDVFYLSRDQVFDRDRDIYLGFAQQTEGLAAGESVNQTASFNIPRGLSGSFYVFGVTDSGNNIYEREGESNNIGSDSALMQVTLAPPADLVVGSISIPTDAVPGQTATISYTIENEGTDPALGRWYDSIYLSADEQWDVDDPLFERVEISGPVNSGESYNRSITAALPGVLPGEYHVIVRSDIRNGVSESDEENNLDTSPDQTLVDAEVLEIGIPDSNTLGQGQSAYYRIDVPAGETLKLSLDSQSDTSVNELYIRYGEMPTRGQFDFANEEPFVTDPEIILPTTEAGTYYVLAYGDQVSGETEYSISAEILPFSLESIGVNEVGNSSPVTLEIRGARFTENTDFELVDSAGNAIAAERFLLQDASTAYVTFDLTDQALGLYDLQATRDDGETANLEDVLTVELGDGADVAVNIDGPNIVRPDRNYLFNINYANTGDGDMSAPLLLLESETSTPMGFELEGLTESGVLQVLGTSGGQLDTLRPGEVETVPVYYQSSTDPINFNVRAISSDSTEGIDWDLVSESVRPLDIPEVEWDSFWGRIQPRIGDTWGNYVELLNELTNEYVLPGEEMQDIRELFSRLYENNPDFLPSSILSGQLLDSDTGEVLNGVEIAAYQIIDEQYILAGTAISDNEGNFTLTNLDGGNYELALINGEFDQDRDGKTDLQPPTYQISKDEDLTDVDVYVQAPTEETFQYNDSDASLVIDDDGTSHILWNRNGSVWHAYFDGREWINPIQVTEETASNLTLQTASNLIDGTESGLIATWEQGTENSAEIYYAVGEITENEGINWSEPIALTNDSINDAGQTAIITENGQVLFNYLKTDYDIQDDADIYSDVVDIQKNNLNWTNDLSETGLHTNSTTSFSYNYDFGKNKFFGLTLTRSFKGEGQVSLDSGKKQAKASASAEYALGLDARKLSANFKGNAKVEGSWNLDHKNCQWDFTQANLNGAVGGDVNWKDGLIVVLGALPVPGAAPASIALRKLSAFGWKRGFKVEAGLNFGIDVDLNGLQWTTKPPFPNFLIPDYIGSADVTLKGGPYLKATSKGGSFSVNLAGSLSGKAQVLPNFKFQEVAGSLKAEMQWGWFGFSKEYKLDYSFDPSSSLLSFLNQEEDEAIEIFYNPAGAIGTSNTYGENFVAADIYSDDAPSTTQAADGTIWMSWIKAGDQLGDQVAVATFDGSQWSQEKFIPNSLGFNSDSSIIAIDDQVLVVWSRADASSVNSETTLDELVEAHDASDIVYSVYTDGVWSEPIPVSILDGNDKAVQAIRQDNGNVTITWINDHNEQSSLLTSTWDGSSWSEPTSITKANTSALTESNIGYLGSNLAVFWTQDMNSDPEIEETSLLYSVYDENWSEPTLFTVDLPSISSENLSDINGEELSSVESTSLYQSSGFILPDIPEEWCDHDDDDEDDYEPEPLRPSDPNDILGPEGFGDERWITATDPLDYTIRFENEPTATAPAQEVIITQQLDDDLDWRTFRVDDFGWGDLYFDLAGDRPFHSERIDLTEEQGFFVDVFTSIDVTTGLATWTLKTIDPATGEAPLDALSGFLPVNDENGMGEGFVSYSIKPKRTAQTGDVVDAEARIVFDTEEPIDTPPIFNTLDAGLPVSTMTDLAATLEDPEFLVNWSGSDDENGSGLAGFTVYVSDNGGEFTPWLENTTLTEASYTGEPGHTYEFYVTAIDNAGNIQEVPVAAQTSTQIEGGIASIGDFVWLDNNADGIQNEEELGLANVTVNLYDSNETLIDTTTTLDESGFYSFSDLTPGDYILEFIAPESYSFSPENQGTDDSLDSDADSTTGRFPVTLLGDQTNLTADAGFYQTASITGQKFHDLNGDSIKDANEPGLSDWTIYLDANHNGQLDSGEVSTLTDIDGNYSFTNLTPGTYTIAEVMQPGWQQTTPGDLTPSISTTGAEIPLYQPNLDISNTLSSLDTTTATTLINFDQFQAENPTITGQGFSTVIIDTGIDPDHPFFGADNNNDGIADRIVFQYDFAENDAEANDISGHGTHVASIAASSDPTYSGIASEANIIALKVFQDDGQGFFSDLEQALQWVAQNAETYNIASVNLSLGDEQNWTLADSHYGIGDELATLAEQNVIVASAAGNNYGRFEREGVAYPAADPNSLAVGAVWSGDFGGSWNLGNNATEFTTAADRIASFSQRDQLLSEVFAPGVPITAAEAGGGTITMAGTSQAAPYISSIAVLTQQLATEQLGRRLTPEEFRILLTTTNSPIQDGDDENDSVDNTGNQFGRVDLVALAAEIQNFDPDNPISGSDDNDDLLEPSPSEETPFVLADNQVVPFTHSVTLSSGESISDIDFGNQQIQGSLPTLAVNTGLTLDEGTSDSITNSQLQVTDLDSTAENLTYTLKDIPVNGILRLNGLPLAADEGFTQADIDNNLLSYEHDGSEVSGDSFVFEVVDETGQKLDETAFNLTINPINDSPVLETNTGLTVDEGETIAIANTALQVQDPDNTADELTYTVTDLPAYGTLILNNTILTSDSTFTQADIDNDRLSYHHDHSDTSSDSFGVSVSDGVDGTLDRFNVNIDVNPVDDGVLNQIIGTAGRDNLTGSENDDQITGLQGRDTITGGAGNDQFIYTTTRDAGDNITDFEAGRDQIVLTELFSSLNINVSDATEAINQGFITFGGRGTNSLVLFDQDGAGGRRPLSLISIPNVSIEDLNNPANFVVSSNPEIAF